MSYKRFDPEDIVISSDAISSPAWSGNTVDLSIFATSSAQVAADSGKYFYNIFNTTSSYVDANIQFAVGYGHRLGSGSVLTNSSVDGNSPSSIVYKQYRNLIQGTEETNFTFGSTTPDDIYVLAIQRSRFKEKLLPGTLSLTLTNGSNSLTLTDNSQYVSTTTFSDAGRIFDLISGSLGVKNSSLQTDGYTTGSGTYGKFLPDVGIIILNADALDSTPAGGGISLGTGTNSNTNDLNSKKLFNALVAGSSFKLRTEETLSSNYIFVRARNNEFNYSTNPSYITGSGELRHSVLIDSPQSYITAVGLYNDNNDLLAVAKLSRPLLKDSTKESLIRVKLDY